MQFAIPNSRPFDARFRCPLSQKPSLIRADCNCLGRGAKRRYPELNEILATDADDGLEYDDNRRLDGQCQRLRELIGERERCSPSRVLLGGSGLDRIPMIAAALGIERIIRLEGDFHGYDRHSLLTGVERVTLRVDPKTRTLSPEALAAAVRGLGKAMLMLTLGGSNPLQTPITRAHVKAAHEANPELVILVDGAYRQYSEQFHLADLADEFERVIYLQVASKDIFLPGPRLSWVVPSVRFTDRLTQIQAPFPLNTGGVRQAIAMLERPELLAALRGEQASARDVLIEGLSRLRLTLISGVAPWVVLQWPGDAAAVVRKLEDDYGVLVQQQVHAPLEENWIRISATTPEEATHIVWALTLIVVQGIAH